MERRQAKGELDEDEMKNLEQDLSGKVCTAHFFLCASDRTDVDAARTAAVGRVEGEQV